MTARAWDGGTSQTMIRKTDPHSQTSTCHLADKFTVILPCVEVVIKFEAGPLANLKPGRKIYIFFFNNVAPKDSWLILFFFLLIMWNPSETDRLQLRS